MSETSQPTTSTTPTTPSTEPPAPAATTTATTTTEPTTEPKPTEPPKDQSLLNKEEPKTEPKAGAPEKYEFKLPDGFELIPEVSEAASSLFKELGLSQESAQKLLDFYVKQTQDAQEAPYKAYADMREGWRKEVEADPEFSGKLKETKETIGRLYDVIKAADPKGGAKIIDDFRQVMDMTGAGDNPAFIRVFSRIAKMLTENTRHVTGSGPSGEGQKAPSGGVPSAAKALYPNLP